MAQEGGLYNGGSDSGDDDDGEECLQLVSTAEDDVIDEELGEQCNASELTLLASEGLKWAEDGKTLRRTIDT